MVSVSVVMAAHNAAPYLRQSIDSVLRQTMPDFELVIVDDGSTDETPQILRAVTDRRVRVLRNPSNLGTAAAGNRGVGAASASLIARFDADDIAAPHWLHTMLAALRDDPQLALVGAQMRMIHKPSYPMTRLPQPKPLTRIGMQWQSLYTSPVYHCTALFPRDCFDAVGGYDERMRRSQDFALFSAMLRRYRLRNLPDVLADCRVVRDPAKSFHAARALPLVREVFAANAHYVLDYASADPRLAHLIRLWPDYCAALRSADAQPPHTAPPLTVFVDAFRARFAALHPHADGLSEIDADARRLLCQSTWYAVRRRRPDALRLTAESLIRAPLLACSYVARQVADVAVERLARSNRA
jgi:glycosyltransferase involved in cell wall biosynthesis